MKRIGVFLLLSIFVAACPTQPRNGAETMRDIAIYYYPFDEQTYVPVTPSTIQEAAACSFKVRFGSEESRLLARAFKASVDGDFDDRVVRVKVVDLYEDPVFIDSEGGVMFAGDHSTAHLTPAWFADVKNLMESMAAREGCE